MTIPADWADESGSQRQRSTAAADQTTIVYFQFSKKRKQKQIF
jgi:hypothetical protein